MSFSKALYFAALVPPQAVEEEVRFLKMEIKKKFGVAHALKLPGHITLIPPVWLTNLEEKAFVYALKEVSENQCSFPVELRDFGRFDQRVIFLNVLEHQPIKELHQKLLQALKDILSPYKYKNLHPHVTLATHDLSRSQFKEVWEIFKNRKTRLYFDATAITIFKHNGKTWDVLDHLLFSEKV